MRSQLDNPSSKILAAGFISLLFRWMREVLFNQSARISYSENGARGNVPMESFNGHFKCPNKSLFCEAESLDELRVIVKDMVNYWNNRRRHASLQNRIPIDYIEEEIQDENRSV